MITANFKAYASYVTDSLYQWDLNQVLKVSGLNISTAPEVHFANANMEKAIVRQAELKNNIVTVSIPNSLLQDPLTIKAYIGIYEGDTFKVIETISIPVKPKARPLDYRFEDTDGEIYSFNALRKLTEDAKADLENANVKLNEAIIEYNDAKARLNKFLTDNEDIADTIIEKANKTQIVEATLVATSWSNGTYSFENNYPSNTYDIEIALNNTASLEQVNAFNSAQIVGSATTNIVKAFGTVPGVDIPIIIRAVVK